MPEIKSAYESVLVVSLKNGEEAAEAIVTKFKDMIEAGAQLEGVDVWGKRKLAYLINKESEGLYIVFTFTADAAFPAELDRVYKITDGVLRWLTTKKD